ncbi:unnamed protein product [Rhizophagus irregularis]|nr:unnamed protein product [Rhizophagus irregularis]
MTVSFTQQSCSLKGNTLGLAVTREVWNSLTGLHDDLDKMLELNHEIDIGEIKRVHRVLLKNTPKENVEFIDGRIQRAGEFRSEVYQLEVPALTEKFIQFRNECTKNPSVHHLIIACRILSAFLHIHPFINDNGRLGRSIMALYFIRNGYPPVVFQNSTIRICIGVISVTNNEGTSSIIQYDIGKCL